MRNIEGKRIGSGEAHGSEQRVKSSLVFCMTASAEVSLRSAFGAGGASVEQKQSGAVTGRTSGSEDGYDM